MIERYSRPEMAALWTDEHKFATWLKVELAACEAMAAAGLIPAGIGRPSATRRRLTRRASAGSKRRSGMT